MPLFDIVSMLCKIKDVVVHLRRDYAKKTFELSNSYKILQNPATRNWYPGIWVPGHTESTQRKENVIPSTFEVAFHLW